MGKIHDFHITSAVSIYTKKKRKNESKASGEIGQERRGAEAEGAIILLLMPVETKVEKHLFQMSHHCSQEREKASRARIDAAEVWRDRE